MKLRNKKTGEHGDYKVIFAGNLIRVKDCMSDESWQYDCLADFNEKWEDYKPAEPLIKDEKIRKAVRAWAEANEITNIYCYQYKRTCEFDCENLDLDCYSTIRFIGDDIIDKRHSNDTYTIVELCGEEECES